MRHQIAESNDCIKEAERDVHLPDSTALKLKTDLTNLRKEVLTAELRNNEFAHDIRILEKLSSDSLRALGDSHLELTGVQTELTKIYEFVCKSNRQTPSRIMLMRSNSVNKESGAAANGSDDASNATEVLLEKLKMKSQLLKGMNKCGDAGTVKGSILTIKDQIKYLKDSVDKMAEAKARGEEAGGGHLDNGADKGEMSVGEMSQELQECQENIVKLKSLLSTKREQIATLRTVLKANKQTAEVALSNLKSK